MSTFQAWTTASVARSDASDSSEIRPESRRTALVLGRALHAPWNEGTRVISRNFADAAGTRRRVRVVSLTRMAFKDSLSGLLDHSVPIEHVYSRSGYSLRGVYLGLPLLMRRVAPLVAAHDVGVAHLFSLPLSLAPWLRSQGTRVVAHVMVSPLHPRQRALVRVSTRLFGPWVDAFAVSSPTLVPLLIGWGVSPSKLVVLPAAIDSAQFRPGNRLQARQRLGLSPDRTLVVYLGRLSPPRFPARIVREALQQAAVSTGRRLHFVALTPGQTFDGSTNSARYLLECARIAEQDLRDIPGVTVDITLQNLGDADKMAWLHAADVVLLPFLAPEAVEPPMTLLEAMACGAQVIVSPAANRSGLIQSGVTGLIYQTPGELTVCLSDALADAARARAVGEAARQAVLDLHSFDSVAAATVRLWQRVEHRRF